TLFGPCSRAATRTAGPSDLAHGEIPKPGSHAKCRTGSRESHKVLSGLGRRNERASRTGGVSNDVHVVPSFSARRGSRHSTECGGGRRRGRPILNNQARFVDDWAYVCLDSPAGRLHTVDSSVPLVTVALDVFGSDHSLGLTVRWSGVLPSDLSARRTA